MPRPFTVQYQSKALAKSDRKHFDEDINCDVDDMANDRNGNINDKLHWH